MGVKRIIGTIFIFKNGIKIKSLNRRVTIIKGGTTNGVKDVPSNTICLESLTKYTGKGPGVQYFLTDNEKIKVTKIGLSDESILDLYEGLGEYIKNVLTTKIK